ncbi:short-chain dehydrogenase [Halenospora varia]|nr:short-chain dehydrogenase [Halenospora varia]
MTSHSEFDAKTTATEVAAAFPESINGKTILLVGVSPSSLGQAMAEAMATHNPSLLILASRSLDKINSVIKLLNPSVATKAVAIDLSSQASIRKSAKEIASLTSKIDIIINNAAVNVQDYQTTSEGIEMHFGTNHVGLFLLTNLLLPLVSANGRIVNLTSQGHRLSPIRFSDYNFQKLAADLPEDERPPPGLPLAIFNPEEKYSTYVAYGQSKTANILFSTSLNGKLVGRGIRSYAVHPGSIWTGLPRNLDPEAQEMIRKTAPVWKSLDEGAATAIVAAFDPSLNSASGAYMSDCQLIEPTDNAKDEVIAEKLWKLSEELVGEKFEIGK